jgi:hypothetical protein
VCDGNGNCVACAVDTDCGGGETCSNNVCVPSHCLDGALSGDEGDVDCGGACPPCNAGPSCNTADDCVSKFCSGTGGAGGAAGAGGAGTAGAGGTVAGICAACATNADCAAAAGTYCDAGVCVDQKADGDACTDAAECLSGFCPNQDGVCCNVACDVA